MALASLHVRGFRVVGDTRLELVPGANYLFGPNGSGKTSLLEAVHYAATGRSFRTRRDAELLSLAGDRPLLSVIAGDELGRVGRVDFDGREKRLELDGRRLDRLSEFFGWLPVVPLLLGDVELIAGAPARRREYLDMAAAKVDREHISALSDYRRALGQYCSLLSAGGSGEQSEAWEAEVARTGATLARRRAASAADLLHRAGSLARGLVGRPVTFGFRGLPVDEPGLESRMRERLASSRKRAAEVGQPMVGPHRDDIVIRFEEGRGADLRRFGSVGEQRAAATALRLAEAGYLRERIGRPPVFLMDEIASELDAARAEALFEKAGESGQVLYAAARPFPVSGRVFEIENGQARQIQAA